MSWNALGGNFGGVFLYKKNLGFQCSRSVLNASGMLFSDIRAKVLTIHRGTQT